MGIDQTKKEPMQEPFVANLSVRGDSVNEFLTNLSSTIGTAATLIGEATRNIQHALNPICECGGATTKRWHVYAEDEQEEYFVCDECGQEVSEV